jgi:hypothetical protein
MIEINPGFFTRFILNTIHGPQKVLLFCHGPFGLGMGRDDAQRFWALISRSLDDLSEKKSYF